MHPSTFVLRLFFCIEKKKKQGQIFGITGFSRDFQNLKRVRVNPDSTNRTNRIPGQPCVGAMYMKAVITTRKQSRRLITLDLLQTYGTLRLHHQVFPGQFRKFLKLRLRQPLLRRRLFLTLQLCLP